MKIVKNAHGFAADETEELMKAMGWDTETMTDSELERIGRLFGQVRAQAQVEVVEELRDGQEDGEFEDAIDFLVGNGLVAQ